MKLSTNTRYAIRVLFELAEAHGLLSIAHISEATGISQRTVENIHAELKNHGITGGTVGARGGISLERTLNDISLGQIVRIFDDGVEFAVCCGDKSNDCPNQQFCETRSVWRNISERIQLELDAIPLDSVLKQYPGKCVQII